MTTGSDSKKSGSNNQTPPTEIEGIDYIIDKEGRVVFTEAYLLKRGYCCDQGCRNCPYRGSDDKRERTEK